MANKLKGLASGLSGWLKKPWQFTGPTSTPEWTEALPPATSYRIHAPATQPKRAIVPHGESEHVFDIKYYVRDRRRAPITTKVEEVSVLDEFEGTAPTVGKWYTMGKQYSILDEPDQGYTK